MANQKRAAPKAAKEKKRKGRAQALNPAKLPKRRKAPEIAAAQPGQKVGKGRPPEHSKFKKGKSGNPKGRPKNSKNVATLYLETADMRIPGSVDGVRQNLSLKAATILQFATKAAKGDPKCMKQYIDQLHEFEEEAAASRPTEFPFERGDLEVLRQTFERMQFCKPKKERLK